ncbi:MAG: hypothetical protein ABGZ17_25575 [Planctomycetaceae bacterium]
MKHLRILFGAVIWLAVVWMAWDLKLRTLIAGGDVDRPLARQLWDYATTDRRTAQLKMSAAQDVAVGDPIFAWTSIDGLTQVGEIVAIDSEQGALSRATVSRASAMFYANCPELASDSGLTYHRTPDSLAWVAATMLPPAKRRAVAEEISRTFQEHQHAIVDQLRPIIQDALRDALQAVESDLQSTLLDRRQEIQAIGGRYQTELIESQIVPLVKQEVWPIVMKRGEPLANEIGLAIWRRVSVWRFTWRYFSDLTPLTRGDRFAQEWRRFVQDEAVPELETHTDDLIAMVKTVLSETSRNPKIQSAVRRNLNRMLNDPELQRTLWKIVREVVFDRPGLRQVLNRHWNSRRTREAFQITAERLEPAAQRIGALLFGSPDTGITPEFRQVLRNRILHKDRRWFVLVQPESLGPNSRTNSGILTLSVTPGPVDSVSPFAGPQYD